MDDHAQAEALGEDARGDLAASERRGPAAQEVIGSASGAQWLSDLPAILSAGLICGMLTAMFAISAAALLFSSVLSSHITLAIGICLFGTIVLSVVIALFSSCPGMLSVTQEVTVVTLAVIAASIHGTMFAAHSEAEILATIVVMIGLATALTGATLFAMGVFRLGRLIRFIPYPVLAGFLAGMGWLIVSGAMAVTLGTPLTVQNTPLLLEATSLQKWLSAVAFALIVDLVARRSQSPMVLPLAAASFVLVFHVAVGMLDVPIADLQYQGWLFAPPQGSKIVLPFEDNPLVQADWTVIWSELPKISALLAVSGAALLFASSGIELSVGRDVDLDRELRAAGLANMLAGTGGGAAGFQGLGLTVLANHLGAPYRITGVLVAAVCAVILFYGATLLSVIPIPLFGGLLLWIGGGLLYQWLIDIYAKVSRREYFVVLLIVALIINVGLLEGLVVGVFAAVALFLMEYARIDVVKYAVTAETYHSRVEHDPDDKAYLRKNGTKIELLRLQGFVFFGTAHQLRHRVQGCFETSDTSKLRFLILDCRDVTGFDSSAIQVLAKVCHTVQSNEGRLIVAGLKPTLSKRLNTLILNGEYGPTVLQYNDVDQAVMWCEDCLLHDWEHRPCTQIARRLADRLARDLGSPDAFEALRPYLRKIVLSAQSPLIQQGEAGSDIYFIEDGFVKVQLETPTELPVHLRTLGPGAIVGEMSFFLQRARTASAIAETDAILWQLNQDDLSQMAQLQPELARTLHTHFLRTIAERLDQSNALVRSLID
ncbi:sulfate transporter [Roseobacter cerasinus]|uniref:Sulfate transporter n=1 Tax=Roseobacter cerasinus TaxID=2602289 RepID=A0A640VS44_9RHOB|nr:SulP family inorganic anion transporter [Roseobacter cerasinus]GFE50839.1 sulfate transporter [Roseobacter cerasinus]